MPRHLLFECRYEYSYRCSLRDCDPCGHRGSYETADERDRYTESEFRGAETASQCWRLIGSTSSTDSW